MIGQTIAHYRILEKLGEGGMGVVYKARDTHLDRLVAIKLLPPEKTADPERKRRFVQEAKAASALNHPHIVTVHDVASHDGVDFIVMECVSGRTLGQLIGRKGLKLNDALKYGAQIADALAAAHGAGIVHRDLKPGNVMVTDSGLVKVLDFGLAKLTEIATDELAATVTRQPETEEGTIVGTVAYMSPEQAEGKKVDARSDIFSFGSVLYEMATGRRAFSGATKLATQSAILHEEPPPLEDAPPELEKIITRCLRKEPARRIQHMDDVKLALEDLKEESDSGKGRVPVSRRRPGRFIRPVALVSLSISVGIVGWILVGRSFPTLVPQPFSPVPLTTYPGFEQEPTFSPDGNQVAFVWDGEKQNNRDIYVMLIGSGRPLRLTTDPADDFSPAWSPDGRSIAFLRSLTGDRAALLLVPPLGGPGRKLAEVAAPGWWMRGPYLAWSPDSASLALIDRDSPTEPFCLFLLSVEGGEKRRLTSPPAGAFSDTGPAFSPDGRSLAFSRALGLGDIYLLPLTAALTPAGELKQLTSGDWGATSPSWLERGFWSLPGNGRDIVFSATWGRRGLWRISASGPRAPESVAFAGEEASYPTVAARSHRLVYTRSSSVVNIWRVDVASGSSAPLIASTRTDQGPEFSPDGTRVTFTSTRSGFSEIWVSDSDGSNAVRLTSMRAPMTGAPLWSPDGNRIVFDSNLEGQFEIYSIGAGGGKPQRLTTDPGNHMAQTLSHDGRWIYFASNRSGDYQIWRMPASGGEPLQVTRAGGFRSMESPDGRYLYYNRTAGTRDGLWRVPVDGGEETQILESVIYRAFDVTTEGIYFLTEAGLKSGKAETPVASLQFLSFTTARTRQIATVEKPSFGLTVSPDHQWILYSRVVQEGSDLMLVENFR